MTEYPTLYYKNDLPSNLDLGDSIALDCEMMGLNFYRDRLCTLQFFCPKDKRVHLVHFDKKNYKAPNIKNLLSDKNKLFLGHMIRLDLQTIGYYLNVIPTNLYCTRTASRIAQTYGASHDLSALTQNLLGIHLPKTQTTTNWGAKTLTPDQIKYAADDVIHLHFLKNKLDDIMHREGREDVFIAAMKMLPHRIKVDINGWHKEDILDFPF